MLRRVGFAWALIMAGAVVACGSDGSSGDASGDAGTGGASGAATGGASGSASGGASGSGAGGTPSGGSGGGGTGGSSSGGSAGSADGGSGTGGSSGGGAEGIAAKYPGDVGIESDPDVIFADDFESYSEPNDLWDNWDNVFQVDQIRFATEPENVNGGSQSIEFTVPQQNDELSNATDKIVSPELDVLYLRYYSKFDAPFEVVGSSHNGAMIAAHYYDGNQATPGVRANGTNKFLVNLENWRGEASTESPGELNVYVYHPEQRDDYGDHFFPSGVVLPNTSLPFDFGSDFVSRPDVIQDLDRWYCYEYMVRANAPGERDGRVTVWLDGVVVADWGNLRFRDVPSLTIDRFGLSFHVRENPNGETHKWYDDVVAAKSYIGPKSN